jgi:hypothetical protein
VIGFREPGMKDAGGASSLRDSAGLARAHLQESCLVNQTRPGPVAAFFLLTVKNFPHMNDVHAAFQ